MRATTTATMLLLAWGSGCGGDVPKPFDSGDPLTPPTADPRVDVVWSGAGPSSTLEVTIHDPQGRTDWWFGMAEVGPSGGWTGEDCYVGYGPSDVCHPVEGSRLQLAHVDSVSGLVDGSTTLMEAGAELAYYLEDANGNCWTWGSDYLHYSALGCRTLSPEGGLWERESPCSGMDPPDPAPLGGRVALTFDDGPYPPVTPRVVDILRNHQPNPVPATFFMVGQEAVKAENQAIVQDIVDDPLFDVANHSWTHGSFPDMGDEERRAEIDDTTDLLESFGATVDYVRLPGGGGSCEIVDEVAGSGHRNTGWHIVTGDYCYAALGDPGQCRQSDLYRVPPEYEFDFVGYVMEDLERTDGGIVLMHDIHGFTADELEGLLTEIELAGFTFTTLDDAEAFPNLHAGTPHDFPWMGEGCRTDDDHCFEVEYLATCTPVDDPAGEQGVCTTACNDIMPCLDRDGSPPTACAEVDGVGQCLGLSTALNDYCGDVPGTVATRVPEFFPGGRNLTVCLPTGW